ncbi:MAG: lytic transglycosylase domain-containing protein [Candidatus Binatus sp.]|uniref:lytic transglycosylase domain-containing protein n=1 Tax=Candidatus Binatus sp. TaxID=2811406 RepID=UPI0027196A0C|nr:lytic transglycosylase domain-containing protein [Candidatus Binatus sp.]MDO8431852.1 lytic transglycosylase domain-containing protein [Candidatus Binatus sp.]
MRLTKAIGKAAASLALVAMLSLVLARPARSESQVPFPAPKTIQPNIDFWVQVFTAYSYRDFVILDRDNVWRTYQIYRLPGEGQPSRTDIEWANAYLKTKYGAILTRLGSGREPSNWEERRVAAMFKGEPLSAYNEAAQNLRVQEGLCEQFREGLLRSRYYRPTMEKIFKTAGVPPELVTLAHVESGFHGGAKSGAGAVGIWQFTRGTGKQYMKITPYHDDRLNPVRSTEAAAKLLRANYETLGDWPLAITAYNYGTGGTARAASIYGGDYCKMVERYNGPRFGFAVKNYYSEFLAALHVHRYEDKYFPGIADEATIRPAPIKCDLTPPKSARKSRTAKVRKVSTKASHRTKSQQKI